MVKAVLLCLLILIAMALAAGPGVRRLIARIIGLPRR